MCFPFTVFSIQNYQNLCYFLDGFKLVVPFCYSEHDVDRIACVSVGREEQFKKATEPVKTSENSQRRLNSVSKGEIFIDVVLF